MSINPQAMQGGPAKARGKGNPVGKVISEVGNFVNELARINRFKTVAILIWLAGVFSTSLFINSLTGGVGYSAGSTLSNITIGIYTNALLGALVVQLILTTLQAPIWSGRGATWWSIVAAVLDVLINAAVAMPLLVNFSNTGVWDFVVYVIGTVSGGQVNIWNQGDNIELAIMLIGAIMVAAGPEAIWQYGVVQSRRGD